MEKRQKFATTDKVIMGIMMVLAVGGIGLMIFYEIVPFFVNKGLRGGLAGIMDAISGQWREEIKQGIVFLTLCIGANILVAHVLLAVGKEEYTNISMSITSLLVLSALYIYY